MASRQTNLFSFDRSRTPSPPVFDNDFSDFDSESEQDTMNWKNTKSNSREVIDDQDAVFCTSTEANEFRDPPVQKIHKPNFSNSQSRYDETAGHIKANCERKTDCQDSLNNGFRTEDEIRVESKQSEMEATDKKSQAVRNGTKGESDVEKETEIDDRLKDWNKLWVIQKEDLLDTQTSTNSTIRVDSSLTESARKPVPITATVLAKYQKYPRVYHQRSSGKLTLSLSTNFRLFQTERLCRRQF